MSKLKVALYCSTKCHSKQFLDLVMAGFEKHGIKAEYHEPDRPVDCDLAVFWGHRQNKIIDKQKKDCKDYLVVERGYVGDRFQWTGMGFNGLNGHAEFYANNMPKDRWDKYFPDHMRRWRNDNGDYVLLIGQVNGDASVKGIDIHAWCQNTCNNIKMIDPEIRVRYRQHPVEVKRGIKKKINGAERSNKTLAEDLDGARCCVTYNSNTGVDAVLAGVPVVTMDKGSMVYNLAAPELDLNPPKLDRTQWTYNMAYCQWLPSEIKNGDAWEHLKQRYE